MSGADATARRERWSAALLRERAALLARVPTGEAAPVVTRLVCAAGDALYGLSLARLARVIDYRRPTPTPSANPAVIGALASGGGFYLIYDLALTIDPARKSEERGHIVLLRRSAPLVGLRVQEAVGVVDLAPVDANDLSGLTPLHSSISGFARHPDGRLVSLVDLNKLLPATRSASQGGS